MFHSLRSKRIAYSAKVFVRFAILTSYTTFILGPPSIPRKAIHFRKISDGRILYAFSDSCHLQPTQRAGKCWVFSNCWFQCLKAQKPSRVVFWIQVDASGPNFPGEKDIHVLKIIKDSKNASHGSPPKKRWQNTWYGWVFAVFFFDSKHFFGTKAEEAASRLLLFQGRACSVHWNSVLTEVRFSSQPPTTRTFSRFSLSQKRVIDHKLFAITFLQKILT